MINNRYNEYLDFLINGVKNSCSDIINALIDDNTDVKKIYSDMFQKSMYEIGSLWENNKISVSTEHLATAITERLMLLTFPKIVSSHKIGKKVIIANVENEYHQIGARMVYDTFEFNGWDSYFLGQSTPSNDILGMVDDISPDIIGISISMYFNLKNLKILVELIQSTCPKLQIIVGGQALKLHNRSFLSAYKNLEYIESLDILENQILK